MEQTLHPYWELEQRAGMDIDAPESPVSFLHVCTETERPMLGGNPLPRKGNRYIGSMVRLYVGDDAVSVFPDTARTLASALVSAAKLADEIDAEDGMVNV